MDMKKRCAGIIVLILVLNLVSAFGVSSPYWGDRPLVMAKGEKKIIEFTLQNKAGDEDLLIKAEMIKGHEIAEMKYEEMTIGAGTTGNKFPVEIKMPRNATEPYTIEIIIKTAPAGKGAPVTLGVGAGIRFQVYPSEEVVEPSLFENKLLWFIIIGIIALVGLILIILGKKKKKKSKKDKKAKKK